MGNRKNLSYFFLLKNSIIECEGDSALSHSWLALILHVEIQTIYVLPKCQEPVSQQNK